MLHPLLRTAPCLLAATATFACSSASGTGGAGGESAAGTQVSASTTEASSSSSSSGTGEATTPEACAVLALADCMGAGCVWAPGFRFDAGVRACEVPVSSCSDAEPIERCLYDDPGTAYLAMPIPAWRVVDGRTEVLLLPGIPTMGTVHGWSVSCSEYPVCEGFPPDPG